MSRPRSPRHSSDGSSPSPVTLLSGPLGTPAPAPPSTERLDLNCLNRRSLLRQGIDTDALAAPRERLELHPALDHRVDGEVPPQSDVAAGMDVRAALAKDDVSGD